MSIFINPGSGPVADATRGNADFCIAAFVDDLGLPGVTNIEFMNVEHGGRFTYTLRYEGRTCEVDMPGLPLERVRYTQARDQNIWDFPRLYVDGSSWAWCFGCGIAVDRLEGREDS